MGVPQRPVADDEYRSSALGAFLEFRVDKDELLIAYVGAVGLVALVAHNDKFIAVYLGAVIVFLRVYAEIIVSVSDGVGPHHSRIGPAAVVVVAVRRYEIIARVISENGITTVI